MYKLIIFAKNFEAYINSQQKIKKKIQLVVYLHWTSTAISHIGPNLPYLHLISDKRPKCNPCYATFTRRLAKTAKIMQNKQRLGNDAIIATMMLAKKLDA